MAPEETKKTIIVRSAVSRIAHENDCRVSEGVVDALDLRVRALLDRAIQNARAAGRKTLAPADFPIIP